MQETGEAAAAATAKVKENLKKHKKEILVGLIAGGSAAAATAAVASGVAIAQAFKHDDKCVPGEIAFQNHSYFVLDVFASWEQQDANCKKVGARIADITSAAENDFLISMLAREDGTRRHMWIGMNYVKWPGAGKPSFTNKHTCGTLDRMEDNVWPYLDCTSKLWTICKREHACRDAIQPSDATKTILAKVDAKAESITTTPLPLAYKVLARQSEGMLGNLGKKKLTVLILGTCACLVVSCFIFGCCALRWWKRNARTKVLSRPDLDDVEEESEPQYQFRSTSFEWLPAPVVPVMHRVQSFVPGLRTPASYAEVTPRLPSTAVVPLATGPRLPLATSSATPSVTLSVPASPTISVQSGSARYKNVHVGSSFSWRR